jgi:hypothetical protein
MLNSIAPFGKSKEVQRINPLVRVWAGMRPSAVGRHASAARKCLEEGAGLGFAGCVMEGVSCGFAETARAIFPDYRFRQDAENGSQPATPSTPYKGKTK